MDGETRAAGRTAPLDALGLLQEPVRVALYRHVVAAGGEVSRNDAAAAAGVGRTLAAFHLDKLAEAGLLEVSFRRLNGRAGPGAGRPAKLYRRAAGEVSASVPPRAYETAARLLADTVEQTGADLVLARTAREFGTGTGRREAEAGRGGSVQALVMQALAAQGFEPYADGSTVRLRNCPFHRLAEGFPALVCGMNLAMLEGLLDGLGAAGVAAARMDPAPGRCCVAISPADPSKNNTD